MTSATYAPTLRVVVVEPRDFYDTQRCARCRQPMRDLDVIAVPTIGPATHLRCLSSRQRAALPTEAAPEDRCWWAGGTADWCYNEIAAHNLCAAHHAQLCHDGPKKQPRPR